MKSFFKLFISHDRLELEVFFSFTIKYYIGIQILLSFRIQTQSNGRDIQVTTKSKGQLGLQYGLLNVKQNNKIQENSVRIQENRAELYQCSCRMLNNILADERGLRRVKCLYRQMLKISWAENVHNEEVSMKMEMKWLPTLET